MFEFANNGFRIYTKSKSGSAIVIYIKRESTLVNFVTKRKRLNSSAPKNSMDFLMNLYMVLQAGV